MVQKRDDHFRLCIESGNLFSKEVDQLKQLINDNEPFRHKRMRLSGETSSLSNISIANSFNINNNNIDNNSNRTASRFGTSSTKNDLAIGKESNLSETITKFILDVDTSESIMNRTITICKSTKADSIKTLSAKEKTENDTNILNRTIIKTRNSTKNNKKMNKTIKSNKNLMNATFITESPKLQRPKSKDENMIINNNSQASLHDNLHDNLKDLLKKTPLTKELTNLLDCNLLGNDLLNNNNLLSNDDSLLPTPSKYNLRKSVRLVKKNYAC